MWWSFSKCSRWPSLNVVHHPWPSWTAADPSLGFIPVLKFWRWKRWQICQIRSLAPPECTSEERGFYDVLVLFRGEPIGTTGVVSLVQIQNAHAPVVQNVLLHVESPLTVGMVGMTGSLGVE